MTAYEGDHLQLLETPRLRLQRLIAEHESELARAALEVAFGPSGSSRSSPSRCLTTWRLDRVMEKAGFVYERDIRHTGMPHVLYRRGHC